MGGASVVSQLFVGLLRNFTLQLFQLGIFGGDYCQLLGCILSLSEPLELSGTMIPLIEGESLLEQRLKNKRGCSQDRSEKKLFHVGDIFEKKDYPAEVVLAFFQGQ